MQRSFARIRDIAAAMRTALERRDWAEVGRQVAAEWDNRKQLAPGVTTPEIDAMLARGAQRRRAGRQGLRRRRRRLPVLLRRSRDIPAIRQALHEAGARVLDFTIEARGLLIDNSLSGCLSLCGRLERPRAQENLGDDPLLVS